MYATSKKTVPDLSGKQPRAGIVVVLTGFTLVAVFAILALSVDTGRIMLEETRMQNAVDAAALAAVQEITKAVYVAGQGGELDKLDDYSLAVQDARAVAAQVAAANGVTINPEQDVRFGRRTHDVVAGTWPIEWDVPPYNVIQVTARRAPSDSEEPGNQFPLMFGPAVGRSYVTLTASATAFIRARDMVLVLDYSASMNDDSSLKSSLGLAEAEAALDAMWDSLQTANPQWPGTTRSKFRAQLGAMTTYEGIHLSGDAYPTVDTIFTALKLGNKKSGLLKWPYPQAGRDAHGDPQPWPSDEASQAMWEDYIDYVMTLAGPYNRKYGFRTLMDYMQEERHNRSFSEDLWRTPHYPFHALKNSTSLFLEFLTNLDFWDEVGLVSYSDWSVPEVSHYDGQGVDLDISADPITRNYATIDTIQQRHQAGDYGGKTALGDGIHKARVMLQDHARDGAQATMLIMTDGNTNQAPAGWDLPIGFDWTAWTDYDGDGTADYEPDDVKKQYAFHEACLAIQEGATLHTISVGNDADDALMRAIAFASGGIYVDVPGGTDVNTVREQMLNAFRKIAAQVPPASLVNASGVAE